MDQLGFDADQKNWAEVLFHTLSDSDALEKYGSYFTGSKPAYNGDSSDGDIDYGGNGNTDIDVSHFCQP